MRIEAISPLMSATNCQPIKSAKFAGRKAPETFMKEQTLAPQQDSFSHEDPFIYQKYQDACELAAKYKVVCDVLIRDKFQQLAQDGSCLA